MGCCCGGNETLVLTVEGMNCGHCKASVEKAVSGLEGVSKVEVDLGTKKVTINYKPDKLTEEDFKKAITNQGYKVV